MTLTKIKLAQMDANSVDSDQYVDGSIDNAHLADGAVDSAKLGNNLALGGTLTVGVDDTGHDVKFFGASSGKYWEWDEAADKMIVNGQIDAHGQYNIKAGGEFFKYGVSTGGTAWSLAYDDDGSSSNWSYSINSTKDWVKLYGPGSSGSTVRLETKSTGIDVTGDLDVSSEITTTHLTINGGTITGQSGYNIQTSPDGSSLLMQRVTANGNPDTVDGRTYTYAYSHLQTRDAEDLFIELDDATIFEIKWADGSNYANDSGRRLASFKPEAGVKLFYNDANKLETTTAGVTVTGTVTDSKGDVRNIPASTNTTLVAADAGKHISITAGITINASTDFAIGDAVTIFNNQAAGNDETITATGIDLYLATDPSVSGATNRTLAPRGVATILCVAADKYVITGAGLT